MLEELARYYENCASMTVPEDLLADTFGVDLIPLSGQAPSQLARDHVGIALDSAARLGKRTAELHLALAAPSTDPAFSPEPLSLAEIEALMLELRRNATRVFDVLRDSVARLPDEFLDLSGMVLARRKQILESFRYATDGDVRAKRTRIHGDYHLGQVLRVRTDFLILDFEGEPARPMEERRQKQSPLKDVAGMLRSFSYAAYAALMHYTARRPEDFEKLQPWARLWEQSTAAEFLRAYLETVGGADFLPAVEDELRALLTIYWLDKALYELSYELNNRPAWVRIPLMGILSLPVKSGGREWNKMPFRSQG
jgi:maltose alpha-D-glucosyltransferase/alpha-amylase